MPPIRGIVHAAGVLHDATVIRQSWESFEAVLSSKVRGAWNLHRASSSYELDFCVVFSSLTSVFGAPGQASYAAANAYLDALAAHRRRRGMAGLAMNWGPWADIGMASRMEPRQRQRLRDRGIYPLAVVRARALLRCALQGSTAELIAFRADWGRLAQMARHGAIPAVLRDGSKLLPDAAADAQSAELLRATLAAAGASGRADIVRQLISSRAAQVLGLGTGEQLKPSALLTEFGLDSLMVVELRAQFRQLLGLDVPIGWFWEGLDVATLACRVADAWADERLRQRLTLRAEPADSGVEYEGIVL